VPRSLPAAAAGRDVGPHALAHLGAVDIALRTASSAWDTAASEIDADPGDEILGAGGTLAVLAAGGARLRLVAVTDGEASHPAADPRATARRRTAESADALRRLGFGASRWSGCAFRPAA
jgi:hypothetical protein